MNTIITTNNLNKKFGKDSTEVHALKECNVEFKTNAFTAIIGTSGSGKSTLLHLLGGLDTATSGNVCYDGKDIQTLSDDELAKFRRRNIGFIFQAFNLIPELTAKENILLPLMLDNAKQDKGYFEQLTKTLGIAERLSHYPSQLSGGQQQRVAIARALINKPKVILCDEPTGNLDKKSGNEVIQLLRKLQSEYDQTIIMVTHDSDIASSADKIIHIEDGEIQ